MTKTDETPIGNFGRRVWAAIKEYGLVFLAGAASGVGITLAVQAYQDQPQDQVTTEDVEELQL